ncbi:MAG: hypothetical protein WBG42_03640 [Cryomorphaceae bacterium]
MILKDSTRIFDPSRNLPNGFTHASCPVGLTKPNNTSWFRVFFSSRDKTNQSHIFYADFVLEKGKVHLVEVSQNPVLSPGNKGLFDQHGVTSGSLLINGNELWLYYLGWSLQVDVPWTNTIGLARSTDFGNTFSKTSLAPIMDRSEEDPYSMSYPWVIKEQEEYIMYYGSNEIWGDSKYDMLHGIKRASSRDGVQWVRNQEYILRVNETYTAFSRPSVIRTNQGFDMLVSVKDVNGKYDLKRYLSQGNNSWKEISLPKAPKEEWDSEEATYPSWLVIADKTFVLHNGNGYGKTGFGIFEIML